jgi:hypothetical protein
LAGLEEALKAKGSAAQLSSVKMDKEI